MSGPPSLLQPGYVFANDYRIVRQLSQGGMGAVFIVDQVSTGKHRALKVMHGQLAADERFRERFIQEARINIDSLHTVEVLQAGHDVPTNMLFLVMELLSGEELTKYVQSRGPLPPQEVLTIFEQLCHAIGAAHRKGIVHRDLKPDNIFVANSKTPGAPFTIKVLDFGIAKLVAESTNRATEALGTPLWMAPEQAQRAGKITPSTDVWSLGLIAYYLLTGKIYWNSASDEQASIWTLLNEIGSEPLTAPSQRAAAYRVYTLPQGFDDWFASCVVRDSSMRFATANEALVALTAVLKAPAPASQPATNSYETASAQGYHAYGSTTGGASWDVPPTLNNGADPAYQAHGAYGHPAYSPQPTPHGYQQSPVYGYEQPQAYPTPHVMPTQGGYAQPPLSAPHGHVQQPMAVSNGHADAAKISDEQRRKNADAIEQKSSWIPWVVIGFAAFFLVVVALVIRSHHRAEKIAKAAEVSKQTTVVPPTQTTVIPQESRAKECPIHDACLNASKLGAANEAERVHILVQCEEEFIKLNAAKRSCGCTCFLNAKTVDKIQYCIDSCKLDGETHNKHGKH